MFKIANAKHVSFVMLGLCAMVLSACVGGTTYGTGVTQERQLLKDLEGMLSMGAKKKRTRITYSARPDLILPNQTTTLPQPLDQSTTTSGADWPESPEQRLARVRGEAEVADARSGELSVAEMRRKKTGIRVLKGRVVNPQQDRDGHDAITNIGENTRKNASRLKRLSAKTTTGLSRKYLTEPPVEYRIPANTAPSGDLGVSEAEKDRRAEKAARIKLQEDTGMWTDN